MNALIKLTRYLNIIAMACKDIIEFVGDSDFEQLVIIPVFLDKINALQTQLHS